VPVLPVPRAKGRRIGAETAADARRVLHRGDAVDDGLAVVVGERGPGHHRVEPVDVLVDRLAAI
jgi:hypothetical protein